jgi:6,7-dimethyl-8-ribityllumazine synthase
MLTPVPRTRRRPAEGRFAIVASRYNSRFVDAMVRAAKAGLARAGIKDPLVVRVPGAYEIPIVAMRLARAGSLQGARPNTLSGSLARRDPPSTESGPLSAIICLGVILRGETTHAAHIAEAVSRALMQVQLEHEVPVIHEVLLLENVAQAHVRCLSREHNRGTEAAQTALAMAKLLS